MFNDVQVKTLEFIYRRELELFLSFRTARK